MAWRVCRQPDGLYSIYSEVVDDFTYKDLTLARVVEVCKVEYDCGDRVALDKVMHSLDEPNRYEEALQSIELLKSNKAGG